MDFNLDFNAPMFVDFGNEDFDANPESYFEIDHEAEVPLGVPQGLIADEAGEEADNGVSETKEENVEEPTHATNPPVNLVSSWSKRKTRPVSQRCDTPTRLAQKREIAEFVEAVHNSPKIQLPERLKVKRLINKPISDTSKTEIEAVKKNTSPSISRWRKVVNQMTPEFIRKAREGRLVNRINSHTSSSSDKSNDTTKFYKEQLKKKRILSAKTDKITPPVVKPATLTEPKPFSFATDSRIKSGVGKVLPSSESVDFLKVLRNYKSGPSATSSVSSSGSTSTKVQPFSFTRRARSVEPSPSKKSKEEKFVSTAELMKKYQSGTPDRFHSLPRGRSSSANSYQRRRSPSPKITIAQTPKLMTKGRSRPTYVMSREEIEKLELEEAQRKQFRATAVNEGVKPIKLAQVEKKPLTKVEPFHFSSVQHRPPAYAPEEPSTSFHAKPVPKKILEGPVGIPERRVVDPIVPHSPSFSIDERLKSRKRPAPTEDDPSESSRVIRARPVPHFGVPNIVQNVVKPTQPEPFSFLERDIAMMEKKQRKIAAILEEEKKQHEFKARPLPNLNRPVNLPIREIAPPTKPEPFDIQIDKRVEERLHKWQEEVKRELKEQREAANFRAKPSTVLDKQPFQPKPSDKPLSEVSNFELHSDRRAREREEFEQLRKQKEAELEASKRQLEQKRKREEELEMMKARKEAVHKAQPIKHYNGIKIEKSQKPVTAPISPKFHTTSRLKKGNSMTFSDINEDILDNSI